MGGGAVLPLNAEADRAGGLGRDANACASECGNTTIRRRRAGAGGISKGGGKRQGEGQAASGERGRRLTVVPCHSLGRPVEGERFPGVADDAGLTSRARGYQNRGSENRRGGREIPADRPGPETTPGSPTLERPKSAGVARAGITEGGRRRRRRGKRAIARGVPGSRPVLDATAVGADDPLGGLLNVQKSQWIRGGRRPGGGAGCLAGD